MWKASKSHEFEGFYPWVTRLPNVRNKRRRKLLASNRFKQLCNRELSNRRSKPYDWNMMEQPRGMCDEDLKKRDGSRGGFDEYLPSSVSTCLIPSDNCFPAKVSPDMYLIDHNSITPSDFQEQQMMARISSQSQGWWVMLVKWLVMFFYGFCTSNFYTSFYICWNSVEQNPSKKNARQCCPHRNS